jgi:4-cresol dehydrogenase (hydroxylating)
MAHRTDRAVIDWRAALGDAAVSTDVSTLAGYQLNTSEFAARELVAVLRPSSLADVRQIIAVACSTGVPVHPISTGHNWGFGSALPPDGPTALLDLGRMNRILDVNPRFRYAVVEPGVTQGQLSDHLRGLDSALKLNVTGAGTDTSIVGNVLDRGCGNLGARIDDLLGLEIALGNGDVMRTGRWDVEHDDTAIHYYPHGIGPDLRGLFVQSGFGVVTKMVLRLHPANPIRELTMEVVQTDLPSTVDAMRLARDDGLITGHIRISDGTDPVIRYFRATEQPTWKTQVTIRGTAPMRAAAAQEIGHRMRDLAARIDTFDTEHGVPQHETAKDQFLLQARLRLINGIPSNRLLEDLAGGASGPVDLDRDRSLPGLLCVNVVLPFSGDHIELCRTTVQAAAEEAGVVTSHLYEAAGPTALFGLFPFYFDRHDATAVAAAHAFKDMLLKRLDIVGIHPARMDIDSTSTFIDRTDDGYWRTISAVKKALDPHGIISGNYVRG